MNIQTTYPLTPQQMKAAQIKQRLQNQGITLKTWAETHGYPPQEVYKILNGERKAHYGRAHEIAVKLGLKEPLQEVL